MFDTIFGLPVHALVVHAVVVLLPLSAVGGLLVALVPKLRNRYGSLVALVSVATVPAVFVAQQSGQQLRDRVDSTLGSGAASAREAALLEQHAGIATNLLPWSIVLAVALVALMAVALRLRRTARRTGSPTWLRAGGLLAAAGVIAGAALSVYWVIRIGDAGARAAWSDVVTAGG